MAREVIITPENCTKITKRQKHGMNPSGQAQAWQTVFNYCIQNGMEVVINKTGIELVILFIESQRKPKP